MATVKLRLHGGPCDGQTAEMDVTDVDQPPDVYTARVHGPHEAMQSVEYRRTGREADSGPGPGVWIYQADSGPR
jgi:hypothetical protein